MRNCCHVAKTVCRCRKILFGEEARRRFYNHERSRGQDKMILDNIKDDQIEMNLK